MRPKIVNKKPIAIVAAMIIVAITLDTLDKPSRLTTAAFAETRREKSQADRQWFAGSPAINSYPQVIHNPQKLWKSRVKRATVSRYNHKQWRCLDELIQRESGWRLNADNPHSTAFGLFQLLKLDPKSKLQKQIEHGLRYIQHRYDSPCDALDHHNRKGWY